MVITNQKPITYIRDKTEESKHTTIRSLIHKDSKRKRKEQRNYKQSENNLRNSDSISPYISIIFKNVNNLNPPIERQSS